MACVMWFCMRVEFSERLCEYKDVQSQYWSSYYTFLGSCRYETKTFRANLCFDSNEHDMQTTDGNNKISCSTNALVLNIFKLILYFNSTVINNQLRNYLTTVRRNFLKTQFSQGSVWLLVCRLNMACYWKSIYQGLKKIKDCIVTAWNIMVRGHQSFIKSFK